MITKTQAQNLFIFSVSCLCIALSFLISDVHMASGADMAPYIIYAPVPPMQAFKYSAYRTGGFEVAKVFGRSVGCRDVDAEFIEDVNDAAVRAGLDPRVFASTIATESSCNPFAVSIRGAIGFTQVVPAFHKNEYDFSRINLLNRHDNLRVGAEIEAHYIQQNGITGGVTRYQGLAKGCDSCDDQYTAKVLKLADGK
jgi:Transglycosylase SLT domain